MSSNTETDTENQRPPTECSFVEPTFCALLTIDILLLLFLSYKIVKFLLIKPETKLEKKTRNYRLIILAFIFLSLLLRGVFGFYKMFTNDKTSSSESSLPNIGIIALNSLPLVFFVSIASAFSYYWHNLYTSFERSQEVSNKSSKMFQLFLIGANVSIYVIFIALVTVSMTTTWEYGLLALNMCFMLYLIISTAMLFVHGTRLYDKALKLMTYAGNVVKSTSGFLVTYRTLLFCCVIKILNCGVTIYYLMKDTFIKTMFPKDNNTCDIWMWFLYMGVFIIIGEYILYGCLIMLLDFNASRAKSNSVDDKSSVIDTKPLLGQKQEYSPFKMEDSGNEDGSGASDNV